MSQDRFQAEVMDELKMKEQRFRRLTEKEVEDIIAKCVTPIDHGLHWDFKKMYEDLFEAITGEKHGS